MYSPKHRHGRCILQQSIELPARTPPPTLLFSSQQCQRAGLTRDWKEPQAPRPPLRAVQDLRLPRHQLLKNRAVDEAYLVQGPVPVNSIRKENSKIFFVFASAAQVQTKQCRSRKRCRFRVDPLQGLTARSPCWTRTPEEPHSAPDPIEPPKLLDRPGTSPKPMRRHKQAKYPKAHAPGHNPYPPCQERTPSGPYSPKVALI